MDKAKRKFKDAMPLHFLMTMHAELHAKRMETFKRLTQVAAAPREYIQNEELKGEVILSTCIREKDDHLLELIDDLEYIIERVRSEFGLEEIAPDPA